MNVRLEGTGVRAASSTDDVALPRFLSARGCHVARTPAHSRHASRVGPVAALRGGVYGSHQRASERAGHLRHGRGDPDPSATGATSRPAEASMAAPRVPADRRSGERPDAPRRQRETHLVAVPGSGAGPGDAVPVRRRHVLHAEPHRGDQQPGGAAHDPGDLVPGSADPVELRPRERRRLGPRLPPHAGRRLHAPERDRSPWPTSATVASCSSGDITRCTRQTGLADDVRARPASVARSAQRGHPDARRRHAGHRDRRIRGSTRSAPNGKLRWAVQAPVSYPSDAQWLGHGRILLTDYHEPGSVRGDDALGKGPVALRSGERTRASCVSRRSR